MAYQALYRRYRPRRFGELRGQEHVVRTLRSAVRDDRVGHAYLFSGPRGTGKTTTARILAKALNCEQVDQGEPCGACESCRAVDAGNSFDVIELDAASNNGVDAVRDLIEKASRTSPGRRKVYILDEVHMLSKPAEAALLKTLEEPPPHVVFVLATTDPQKVNETIRSRCQRIEFHLLPMEELADHVRWVAADAGLSVDDATVEAVLRQGRGSARDTLSALDAAAAGGGVVGDDEGVLDEVLEALVHRDAGRGVAAVAAAIADGRDARLLAEQVVGRLRDAFLSLVAPELVALPTATAERVADQAHRLGAPGTVRAIEAFGQLLVDVRNAPDPRVLLDVVVVRLCRDDLDRSVDALLERVERLERQVAQGAVAAAVAAAPPPVTSPSGRAVLGSRVRPVAPAATEVPAGPLAAPPVAVPATPPGAPAAPAAPAADGALPTLAELEAAWADRVMPALKNLTRALYSVGRFTAVDGRHAIFAVPNDVQKQKCEDKQAEVEAVLAARLGRPVPLRVVVDGTPAPARRAPAPTPAPTPPPAGAEQRPSPRPAPAAVTGADASTRGAGAADDLPDVVDDDELLEAVPAELDSGLDRLTAAFPGSELLPGPS